MLLLVSSLDVLACSLARAEIMAPVSPTEMAKAPESPVELTYTIQRGSDKDLTSCSDLGFITIYIKPSDPEQLSARGYIDTGYQFEVVKSDTNEPAYTPFNTDPILPQGKENGYLVYYFAWNDGADKYQEAVKIEINIYAVKSGQRSTPCKLKVEHSGGRTTNKSSQGTQQSCAPA
jgi:hypothetical protein